MSRPLAVALAALSVVSAAAACGGTSPAKKAVEAPQAAAPIEPVAPAADDRSDHALKRSAVRRVVRGGLGLFLQKVVLEDQPVLKDGRFHGFRIAALREPAFWNGVDLRPGDIVVRVNGMPIEHPEEALEAFHALENATELRVFFERQGEARELVYPILADEPVKRSDAGAP